jgi:hypothetical protein
MRESALRLQGQVREPIHFRGGFSLSRQFSTCPSPPLIQLVCGWLLRSRSALPALLRPSGRSRARVFDRMCETSARSHGPGCTRMEPRTAASARGSEATRGADCAMWSVHGFSKRATKQGIVMIRIFTPDRSVAKSNLESKLGLLFHDLSHRLKQSLTVRLV